MQDQPSEQAYRLTFADGLFNFVSHEIRPGIWYGVEIVVNGKSMKKITGCNNSSGYIGLQSEGGPWEARKVTFEPLQ